MSNSSLRLCSSSILKRIYKLISCIETSWYFIITFIEPTV
nr:MAG TPA: hypothetical protein [Caudoviricetes sp.]